MEETFLYVNKTNELYHHGIQAQKWGVQNGPPYPLSEREHKEIVSAKKNKNKAQGKLAARWAIPIYSQISGGKSMHKKIEEKTKSPGLSAAATIADVFFTGGNVGAIYGIIESAYNVGMTTREYRETLENGKASVEKYLNTEITLRDVKKITKEITKKNKKEESKNE